MNEGTKHLLIWIALIAVFLILFYVIFATLKGSLTPPVPVL